MDLDVKIDLLTEQIVRLSDIYELVSVLLKLFHWATLKLNIYLKYTMWPYF